MGYTPKNEYRIKQTGDKFTVELFIKKEGFWWLFKKDAGYWCYFNLVEAPFKSVDEARSKLRGHLRKQEKKENPIYHSALYEPRPTEQP